MSNLWLPDPRLVLPELLEGRPPSEAVTLNQEHFVANGLLTLQWLRSGVEQYGRYDLTVVGEPVPTLADYAEGNLLNASNYLTGAAAGEQLVAAGEWTLFCVVALPSTPADAKGKWIGVSESPGSSIHDREIGLVSGQIGAYLYDGSEKTANTGITPELDKYYPIVATCDGLTLSCYTRGSSASTAVFNPGYAGYADPVFGVGRTGDWSVGSVVMLMSGAANRAWIPAEAEAWVEQPFGCFIPAGVSLPAMTVLPTPAGNITSQISAGSYILSGAAVASTQHRVSQAAAGSYSLTGAATNTTQVFSSQIASGAYVLSGATTATLQHRISQVGQGSYSISGSIVDSILQRVSAIQLGSYSISGAAIATERNYASAASAGAYSIVGATVDTIEPSVSTSLIGSGSYSISGAVIGTLRHYLSSVSSASYVISGASVDSTRALVAAINSGSYVVSGQVVGTLLHHVSSIGVGSYSLTGSPIASFVPAAVTLEDIQAQLTALQAALPAIVQAAVEAVLISYGVSPARCANLDNLDVPVSSVAAATKVAILSTESFP